MDNVRADNVRAGGRNRMSAKKLVMLAMLSAVAYVVMYLSKLIPINIIGFLNFDLKDVIIAIAGFIYGPLAAAGVSVVVSFIEMITISSTGPIGLIMNVRSTCAFICPAAYIYKKKSHDIRGAVKGLIIGALLMTAVMLLWNYLITPIYMQYPREQVAALLLPVFLPYNLVKAGINGTLTMLLYKPVVSSLRKAGLVEPSQSSGGGTKRMGAGVVIIAAVLLITFVLLALVLAGII